MSFKKLKIPGRNNRLLRNFSHNKSAAQNLRDVTFEKVATS
jgi:hypothetical protein